jgi:NAD(P)-dependent dehydrogenase (short-subunit alcohol dehydrogenase family)
VSPLAVVTGGTRGSGAAVAERLRATGFEVDAPGSAELDVTDEAALAAASPLGRLLEPDEVAAAVAFLASAEAGAINGQTLILDGGGIQT